MNQKLIRNIKIDYIYCFLKNFDISSSIWVLYMVYKGMSLWQIGIVEGIFHLTSFLFELPTGVMADLLGRKKMIIAGRICSALSSILCLFGNSMWYFAFAFAIQAIGYNLNSGSEEALIYDSMKFSGQESKYMKVNSRLNVILEIASGMATVIGGILAEYSYPLSYTISVFIAMIAIVPAILFVEPDSRIEELCGEGCLNHERSVISFMKSKNITSDIKNHFNICIEIIQSDTKLRKILLYYPMVFTFYTVVFFYGQEYFSLLGMNKIEISIIMLLAGIMSCIGAFSSEKFLARFGNHGKYLASAFMGTGIIVMSRNNLMVSIIAFAIISYANAVLYPIQSQSINELIPSRHRATIISVDSMIFSLMMIVLFPICGLVADYTNIHSVYLALGVLQLLIMLIIHKKK